MNNDPLFWFEYGRIRQKELIEEAQRDAESRVCPSTSQRVWQWATSQLERASLSLGLSWCLAYTPVCSRV